MADELNNDGYVHPLLSSKHFCGISSLTSEYDRVIVSVFGYPWIGVLEDANHGRTARPGGCSSRPTFDHGGSPVRPSVGCSGMLTRVPITI